ncbi:Multidrug-efflux transporter [Thalassovita gelatinovora]|uniref:Multidrug-efflux transporter n=2 Tax=Thalassovita gelatinovora TaxID=53501 RepID=A0A0P1FI19_THAGE|nr:Multidrug-efflux transporter [Thalassovita gelatinovora]SEP70239.1 multidrug resistance protein, MATE family [Thalassovita gelatinovora]
MTAPVISPMTHSQHVRNILKLGLPLIGSHVAHFAITLTDSVMLGWYDVEVLAAQVIGATLFFVLFIMGEGFAMALMPMVAEAEEAGDETQARRLTRMAIWASVLFGLAVLPILIWSGPVLRGLGQQPGLSQGAQDYLRIAGWSLFPALLTMVLRSFLSALERTQIVLWVTLAAVGLNVVVNYALIFGHWGMPEMGIRGAAVATLVVNMASFILLALYAAIATSEHELFVRFWRPDWDAFGRLFRLGWPIGMGMLAEVGLFAAASMMMGWLGTKELAAHGIALQIASVTFMVHLGLSNAATVRAGRAMGRRSVADLRRGGQIVVLISLCIAGLALITFLTIPAPLLGLFLSPDDPQRDAVIAIGVGLLAAAGLFQLADAAQVIVIGLLRGAQDTKVPMLIAAVSYWLIGMPISYSLGFVAGWGGVGIWIGLAMGLAVAAILLNLRFWGPVLHRIEAEFE